MPGEEAQLAYMAERVRVALATDARTGVLGLVVHGAGGRIFIRGAVPTRDCHDAVVAVAEEISGPVVVVNETTVTTAPEPGLDREVLQ